MIYQIENILNNNEFEFIKKLCKNFKTSNTPKNNNFYVRMKITEIEFLKNIEQKFNSFIEPIKYRKYALIENGSCWINKVDTNTNTNDDFHYDVTDISLIIYINENFEGGELEYVESTKRNQIKIKENLGVILDNKTLHRVLPVTNGLRYSLVCFFVEANSKIKKTLL